MEQDEIQKRREAYVESRSVVTRIIDDNRYHENEHLGRIAELEKELNRLRVEPSCPICFAGRMEGLGYSGPARFVIFECTNCRAQFKTDVTRDRMLSRKPTDPSPAVPGEDA